MDGGNIRCVKSSISVSCLIPSRYLQKLSGKMSFSSAGIRWIGGADSNMFFQLIKVVLAVGILPLLKRGEFPKCGMIGLFWSQKN